MGSVLPDLHSQLVTSLRGGCKPIRNGMIVARNGDVIPDCSHCLTGCSAAQLGLSGEMEIGAVWGDSGIELRWSCPGCGTQVTQDTSPALSILDAAECHGDPLCYRCRLNRP